MDATLLDYTVEELTAKRKTLSEAPDALLSGRWVASSGHDSGQAAFQQTSPTQIRARIAEITEAITVKESGGATLGPRPVHLVL